MIILDQQRFNELLELAPIKPRLKRELRFVKSTETLTPDDWAASELLAITDRSGTKGVLLLMPYDNLYIVSYEISQGITSKTGQAQPIICDFCRTWQSGTRSGSIRFPKDQRSFNALGFLCCADLRCSSHVRGLTNASQTSRAHLREDLLPEQRIERLKERLHELARTLNLDSVLRA